MEYQVAPELIAAYDRDGAVCVERPFAASWIEGLLAEYERIVDNWRAGSTEYPVHENNGALGIQNVILRNGFYRRWAIESPVAEIVAQITQSQSVRFYFDNFFVKVGSGPETATPLHQDVPAFGFQGAQLPSAWLALTDVDMDNAPLITALGSHRNRLFMFRSPIQKPGWPLLPGYREPAGIPAYIAGNHFEIKAWPVRKGDLLVVCPYTIHGALARKTSAGSRIGFSSRWMGDDVRWRGTIYNEVEASTHPSELQAGQPPPDELFPVIYRQGEGNLARRNGEFTRHITLEPRSSHTRHSSSRSSQ